MKTIFGKKAKKFISTLLVCCMVAGIVGIPMGVEAATITADDLYVYNQSGSNTEIQLQNTNVGVKCTYISTGDNGYSMYNRVGSLNTCNMTAVGSGMHLELQDMQGTTADAGYTLVLAIGDNNDAGWTAKESNRAWVKNDHGNATILAVESDGDYKAYTKKCNSSSDMRPKDVAAEDAIASGKLQNGLDGSISIDIVRKGNDGNKWTYDVTVNGETFTIYTLDYVYNPYINFGLYGPDSSAISMTGASFVVTDFSTIVPIESITLSESSLYLDNVGDTATLTATITPSSVSSATVKWTTGNSEVATVENGTVTAVGVGQTEITATIGGKVATCTVM